jgi:hypothetical protein
LKYLDVTEEQTFGFPSAGLGFPSARFGFPSIRLGIPSVRLGIPSVRLGNRSWRHSEAARFGIALGSPQEEAGLGVAFSTRVTHNPLKSPDSREKNRVKIVSQARQNLRNSRRGRVPTRHH